MNFPKKKPGFAGLLLLAGSRLTKPMLGAPPRGDAKGSEHDGFGVGRGLFEGRRRRRKLGCVDLLAVMEAAAHGERGGGDNDKSYNGAHD